MYARAHACVCVCLCVFRSSPSFSLWTRARARIVKKKTVPFLNRSTQKPCLKSQVLYSISDAILKPICIFIAADLDDDDDDDDDDEDDDDDDDVSVTPSSGLLSICFSPDGQTWKILMLTKKKKEWKLVQQRIEQV